MTCVLFVHHGRGIGGASINLLNILKYLDKEKYSPIVLLIHDSNLREELELRNITTVVARSFFYRKFYRCYTHSVAFLDEWYRIDLWFRSGISWLLSWLYFAKQELKSINFDIVHLNSSVLTDWLSSCKSTNNKKVVIHIQEPISYGHFRFRYNFFRLLIKKYADAIVAISRDNANRVNIPDKTFLVHNFVDFKFEDKDCEVEPIKGRVLYLGGDNAIKGFFDVVDSLDYLDEGIVIVFCGNYSNIDKRNAISFNLKNILWKISSHNRQLIKAYLKLRNHPKAEIVGFMSNPATLFLKSEFLISPFSKPHFSRPVIEAFAFKRTAIGTSVEGMDEVINHEINGILIPPGDPENLAKSINQLSKDSEKRRYLANNGFLKANKLYDFRNIKRLEDVYSWLIHSKG